MPYQYLLDTNILSDLVRHPQGRISEYIVQVGEASIWTSILVACELRFGAQKKGSRRLTASLEAILDRIPVLPLDIPGDRQYAEIRTALEQAGTPIGPNDLLIAAHALALDVTLVTANTLEFQRVANLRLDNWLTRSP